MSPVLRSRAIRARNACHVDAVGSIGPDVAQGIAAEPGEVHGLFDAAMRCCRSISRQQCSFVSNAALPRVLSEHGGSRHQHRHQVGHRRAGDENPASLAGETEYLARPLDDLTLDLKRDVIAPAEIGVQPGGQHLGQHADWGAAAMHPSHEARVNVAGRIGNDEIGEFPIDLVKIGRFDRKVGTKPPADFIRYRLPNRTLPDVSDIVEHVIEHAMTLRANFVPVLRIERLARCRLQA